MKLDLTKREKEIVVAALPVHLGKQLPGEPNTPANAQRRACAYLLVGEFPRASGEYSAGELNELGEACDSYLYWEVSDERDRHDAVVCWDPEEVEPGSKMDRKRSAEYVATCREVARLGEKLLALAEQAA
jgi:hypothetical protein